MRLLRRRLKVERERVGLPDASGAGEDLSGRKEREQRPQHRRSELRFALHQIILVAAKGGAGVMIDVILDERYLVGDAKSLQRRLQQIFPRQLVGHEIAQMQAFGRRVFDVPHIEIKTAAVEKESAIARRL